MAETLDYRTPAPARPTGGRAAFWATFALSGFVGAPFADWVLESWYHQQHPDGGGFILACMCLAVIAALLFVARCAVPSRTKSPLLALTCGLFGPLGGLVLLTLLFF